MGERVQVACKASFLNSFCKLLIISCTLVNPLASCLWAPVSNGNRTEWSPIRPVIIRVINKIGRPRSGSPICLITSMITDRIGRHEVLLPINHNFNKICDIIGYFLNQNTRNSKFCFASSEKKSHLSARVMARTVLLNCPIKAEIRTVDSQSDLRILL